MQTLLLSAGIACVIAAVVGGGLKAFDIEIPVLSDTKRQIVLAVLGVGLGVAAFFVPTDGPPPPPPSVHITLSKTSGPPGTRVRVSSTEFDPGETVFITFGGLPLKETVADEDGHIRVVVAIPKDIPPNFGANYITALGEQSKKSGVRLFEITGRSSSPPHDGTPTPSTLAIPPLRGVDAAFAGDQLRVLGFQVTERLEFDEEVPAGQVVSTDPPAGTEVVKGSSIVLIVSQGPQLMADLSVALSFPDQAAVDTPTSYKLTAINDGPNPATNVSLTGTFSGVPLTETDFDLLPNDPGWTCGASAVDDGVLVTCTIPTLEVGQSTLVVGNVVPGGGGTLTLDAAIATSPESLDPNEGNNHASAATPVA